MDRLAQLQVLHNESPEDEFLLFAIAKEYEKRDEDEKALIYYNRLREINPEYVGLYYHLAKLWERRDDITMAFRLYTEGMKIASKLGDRHALSELAGARLLLGDEEDFM